MSKTRIYHSREMKNLSNYAFTFHTCHPTCHSGGIMLMHKNLPEATFQRFPFFLLRVISLNNALLTLTKMTTRKVFFSLLQEYNIHSGFIFVIYSNGVSCQPQNSGLPANIYRICFKDTVIFQVSLWFPSWIYCFHGENKGGESRID